MHDYEAAEILQRMVGLWPNTKMSEDLAGYWLAMLEHEGQMRALGAVEIAINESKFFPSVAEFRRFLADAGEMLVVERRPMPELERGHMSTEQVIREAATHWIPIIRETLKNAKKPTRVRGVSSLGDSIRL